MNQDTPSIVINPDWPHGPCPSCQKTIYIDEANRRSYHKAPLCEWYSNFVKNADCEGEIELVKEIP